MSTLPTFTDSDLQNFQALDPAIKAMILHVSDPSTGHVTPQLLDSVPELKPPFNARGSLCVVKGLLIHVFEFQTSPAFIVPHSHGGPGGMMMLMHAQDSPRAGHKETKATCKALLTGSVLAAHGKRQKKLSTMQVDPSLISWMTDYLTDRPQFVRIGSSISSTTTSSTGAPHCTVFSVSTVQAVFVNKDLFCITCLTK